MTQVSNGATVNAFTFLPTRDRPSFRGQVSCGVRSVCCALMSDAPGATTPGSYSTASTRSRLCTVASDRSVTASQPLQRSATLDGSLLDDMCQGLDAHTAGQAHATSRQHARSAFFRSGSAPAYNPPSTFGEGSSVSPAMPNDESGAIVLVAKILTKSDAKAKRIILPRVVVEANLPNVANQNNATLRVQEQDGRKWTFVVKSWSNGESCKPVYVLEQVSDYLRAHKLSAGDAVGLVSSPDGTLYVEANTDRIREAAEKPTYTSFVSPEPEPEPEGSYSDLYYEWAAGSSRTRQHQSGRSANPSSTGKEGPTSLSPPKRVTQRLLCTRTQGCHKPAGHQGWCSGHKGYKRRATVGATKSEPGSPATEAPAARVFSQPSLHQPADLVKSEPASPNLPMGVGVPQPQSQQTHVPHPDVMQIDTSFEMSSPSSLAYLPSSSRRSFSPQSPLSAHPSFSPQSALNAPNSFSPHSPMNAPRSFSPQATINTPNAFSQHSSVNAQRSFSPQSPVNSPLLQLSPLAPSPLAQSPLLPPPISAPPMSAPWSATASRAPRPFLQLPSTLVQTPPGLPSPSTLSWMMMNDAEDEDDWR